MTAPPADIASSLARFRIDPDAELGNIVVPLTALLIGLDRRRGQQQRQHQQAGGNGTAVSREGIGDA